MPIKGVSRGEDEGCSEDEGRDDDGDGDGLW